MICLEITGINIASILSSIFSINALYPFSIEISRSLLMFFEPNLRFLRPFSFSFSLIHVIPWSYGSIIREYLSELVNIVPFSTDTWSVGNYCLLQRAITDSGVRILTGLGSALTGTWLSLINFMKSSFIIFLYFLLKIPAYDTKELAITTSPTIKSNDYYSLIIDFAHLSFSDPKAITNLWAKFNLLEHLSAS